MMKRFVLSLILTMVFVGNLLAQNTSVPTYDVRRYGAKGDGTTDDTASIQAAVASAVAYQAANDKPAMVIFPRGTYLVQDPTSGDHYQSTAGPVNITSTAEDIVLMGYDATLKIGTNGVTTAAVRLRGNRCRVYGLTVDANAANAPVIAPGDSGGVADTYKTKGNSGFEINSAEDCVIKDCKVINADKPVTTYSTGTVAYDHDGADNLSGSEAERLDDHMVTITGGSLPTWVDTDCAITISGTRYPIAAVPSTTTVQLAADSNTADNNPGSDIGAGAVYSVTGFPSVSQGEEGFLMVNAVRCRFDTCHSIDSSWQAFRVSGDKNSVNHCIAHNHMGNGLRILAGEDIYVEDFKSYSVRNDGRHAIIADAGSDEDASPADDSDRRTYRIYINDCHLECNPTGDFDGAASVLKLASAYEAHVSNTTIIAGNATNNIGLRLEDSLRLVTLDGCHIEPNILFTPASTTAVSGSVFQGTITGDAANGSNVQYTVTSAAGLEDGKTIFVRGSGKDQYNGPQQVLSAGSNAITTDRLYVASGSLGSLTYGQSAVDTFVMRNTVIAGGSLSAEGSGAHTHYNYAIEGCIAYNVDIENCEFRMKERVNVKMGGILTDYDSERALTRFRFVNNKVYFNTSAICRVIRGTADAEMLTSGRIVCYGNEYHNQHTGTVYLSNPFASDDTTATYDERDILFSGDGENPGRYVWTTYPVDAVGSWLAGDYIRNSAPSPGEPAGWTCVTAGTGATSVWQPVADTGTLSSTGVEVGNTTTGEDDLLTYTMPANTLYRDGDSLEIEAMFTLAANANAKQVKFYIGGVAYYASGSSAVNDGGVIVRATLMREVVNVAKISISVVTNGGGTPYATAFNDTVSTSLTLSNAVIIKGTGEGVDGNGTSSADIVMQYLRVRRIPAP